MHTVLYLFSVQEILYKKFIIENLAVPAHLESLLFKPWTVFTYMFFHEDFFHILFNMLWLWWLGSIFYEYMGGKKLLFIYIAGGISGALLYIVAYNIFPVFSEVIKHSHALGASAGILAVVVGVATWLPGYRISLLLFGQIELKYIAIFSVVLDVLSISRENPGGHIAHLGGAVFGYLYIRQLQKGKDLSKGFYNFFRKIDLFRFTKKKMKVAFNNSQSKTDEDFLTNKKNKQEIIDAILDKIAQAGYESLNKEEKEILFKASRENYS